MASITRKIVAEVETVTDTNVDSNTYGEKIIITIADEDCTPDEKTSLIVILNDYTLGSWR